MTILDKIIATKKEEVKTAKRKISVSGLSDSEFFARETFSLKKSVKEKTGIIAEFKRQSPSKGIINATANPVKVASAYEKFGASGVSVLTDNQYFGGNFSDLISVRKEIQIPLLRKDFMIDEYQFFEAKSWGADVVLLIASCLSPSQVQEYTALAHELEMEVLLEIHTEEELSHFCQDIDLVGINNRNLKDFKVDLEHSVRLKNLLPKETLSVAESGIYSLKDFQFLKEKGFDAFLMGEFFMKNDNPARAFEEFSKQIF